ncbi:hypothetical protein JCM9140_2576 [Halalkalibacter wakoensis JCM 9140]|uniref:Uncharacterized protein n=1 Tax=Halalkalibacter wakoensis JCM 9140 TaxID=1236970 RepID=W4Q581_9BACI|nr:hypothetical protein [Halalkalibacter wakoensis]GAE26499.1 hypothetical protein JCM9140_2576 [Halalkalibacter wakoensis JCM 9140]
MAIDELAKKRWNQIPADIRKKIESNVFCGTCKVTTIVDYVVDSEDHQMILKGSCKTCGRSVARVID